MAVVIKVNDITRLRKKLEAERRELEEREKALAVVEAMLLEEGEDDADDGDSTETSAERTKRWGENVRDAILELGSGEWAVADIEKRLIAKGIPLPRKNPRSRIAMIVQGLREKDLIQRTYAEEGQPHRYRTTGLGLV